MLTIREKHSKIQHIPPHYNRLSATILSLFDAFITQIEFKKNSIILQRLPTSLGISCQTLAL